MQIDAELRTLSSMPSTVYMSQPHRDNRRSVISSHVDIITTAQAIHCSQYLLLAGPRL